ncbi:MAG TPA: spermidine/putrescine ABC transporter substrate-binding protein [Candidatus Limnocylindrales bacterium]|jgi:spermidine/putrescine transport system substrate-binding protein|nr:spermidine/putrescine ABC transporter substrate-binding protein [Candidatus Limnocylindrales bacterium]
MSQREQETDLERAIARAFARGRYSRRAFLGRTGRGLLVAGSALSLPSILAACGIGPQASPTPGATNGNGNGGTGTLDWANWPFYIDQDEDTGESDTINQFEEETGISVNYREVIEDNESFFGTIQPSLAAGQSAGWDMITPTDYMCQRLIRLGYLQELDWSQLPNVEANIDEVYRGRPLDPNNQYLVPWQSGFTGIGYNIELTGREITSMDDLWNPEFEGRIGMFREMRDTFNFALLRNGVNPTEATFEDAGRAAESLLEQAPLVRNYYGNEYTDGLANGDVALTMAWSGDVYQLQLDNPNLRFVIPDEGGNLWVDNLCIPTGAANPEAAHQMMNFVYQPEIMAQISSYVQFISPVPAARDVLAESDDEEEQALAESELIFPSEATLDRVYGYPDLSDEAEEARWLELFQGVVQG